jgi:hypothetical protein
VLVLGAAALAGIGPVLAQPPAKKEAAPAKAQPPAKKEAAPAKDRPLAKRPEFREFASSDPDRKYVEVSTWPPGKPVLVVDYPWKVYTKPSVEVRAVADDEPDTTAIRPMAFVAALMKGDVTLAVYRALDLTEEARRTKAFKQKGQEFQVVGLKNRLGRAAAQAVFPPKAGGKDTIARVAYYPLEPWDVDGQTLRLELPPEHFSQPTRIRVWFLRDGDVVWWQTLWWPGIAK